MSYVFLERIQSELRKKELQSDRVSTGTKLLWCGFAIVVGMMGVGIVYQIKALSLIGYVFGFPFLMAPLLGLSD